MISAALGWIGYACLFAVVVYGAFNLPRIIRSMRRRAKGTCAKCGAKFDMGYNGIVLLDETEMCDTCAGVERDKWGDFWLPDEQEHLFTDGYKITRAEALGEGR